jgi:hypothetical protein
MIESELKGVENRIHTLFTVANPDLKIRSCRNAVQ